MPISWGDLSTEPLLTAEEESCLALQIEAGLLARQQRDQHQRTTDGSVTELTLLEQLGEQARQRYIKANLRLVASVSRPAAARSGLSENDLFQEGCLGLIQAVARFDCRRGHRFSTYALFWIRAFVGAATASRLGALNLPTGRAEKLRAVRGVESMLTQLLGRPARAAEVAAQLGRPTEWIADLLAHQPPQSFDRTAADLPDEQVAAAAPTDDLRPLTQELLSRLPELERTVLANRLGFIDAERSYVDTAARVGLSVTRVRRLEARALERLRAICPQSASMHL
ncbi:MAG: polymerase primary sigma factor [Propionibacteriaceae bacterium]|nr:polymerase primary sigma factor [Propionibacteriaceae bacterium]